MFQSKMHETVAALDQRLRTLEEKMIRFDAEQDQLIVKAQAAANVAAVGVAGAALSDIVTRVTRIEMQQSNPQPRLPQAP